MSTINKKSVREEVDKLKNQLERLIDDKKIIPEAVVLFQNIFIIMDLILSIFLEKTTKKNNKNSSKPSSQTEKDDSSLTHKKTNGKGKKEHHTTASHTRTVENVTLIPVTQCGVCGEDLTQTKCQHQEQRIKIDIMFEKIVEQVNVEVKYCSSCDSIVKGAFPNDMPGCNMAMD